MYYLLSYLLQDEKKDLNLYGTMYDSEQEVVDGIFENGKLLNPKELNIPFTVILDEEESNIKKRKKHDKICMTVVDSNDLFLVSPAVENLFNRLVIDNLQYFEVRIQSTLLEINDYKIINITDEIDCVDLELSDLTLFDDGNIRRIRKLVLNQDKIPDQKQIFLLGRFPSKAIVVHEKLKLAIENESLTGFQFIELENASEIY